MCCWNNIFFCSFCGCRRRRCNHNNNFDGCSCGRHNHHNHNNHCSCKDNKDNHHQNHNCNCRKNSHSKYQFYQVYRQEGLFIHLNKLSFINDQILAPDFWSLVTCSLILPRGSFLFERSLNPFLVYIDHLIDF